MECRQLVKKIIQHGAGFPVISFVHIDSKMIECPECGGRASQTKYRYKKSNNNKEGIEFVSICITCSTYFSCWISFEELKNG